MESELKKIPYGLTPVRGKKNLTLELQGYIYTGILTWLLKILRYTESIQENKEEQYKKKVQLISQVVYFTPKKKKSDERNRL